MEVDPPPPNGIWRHAPHKYPAREHKPGAFGGDGSTSLLVSSSSVCASSFASPEANNKSQEIGAKVTKLDPFLEGAV